MTDVYLLCWFSPQICFNLVLICIQMFHHSSHNLISLRSHDLDLRTNATGFLFVGLKSDDSVRPDEVVRFTSRDLCLSGPGLGPSAQSNLTPQIVQTLSAVDRDEPEEGQHFLFSLSEAVHNLSFTLRDNKGKVDN